MGAGVGLFLGLIGLKTAGIVVASPATLIKLGHLTSPGPLLAALCFLMIAVLEYRRVFGGILISILSVTLVGWASAWCSTAGCLGAAEPGANPPGDGHRRRVQRHHDQRDPGLPPSCTCSIPPALSWASPSARTW